MSPAPSPPDPADPARQRDEDAQYYRQILHELIDMGADLARHLHRQATPAPNAEPGAAPEPAPAQAPTPDPTIAFDRVARTIRRTIALARKLSEPAPPSPAQRAAEAAQARRLVARKQVIREVEDSIQQRAEGAEAEALHAELYERLDTMDLDDDLDQLPVADIIAAIRRDLGIAAHMPGTHPWKRRTPQDVRDLCARAAGIRTPQPSTTQPRTGDPRPLPAPPPRPRTSTGPPP